MFYLGLHNYFEIAALLTAIVVYFITRNKIAGSFALYLLFIVSIELTGRYMNLVSHKVNFQLYNMSVPVEYLFFTWIFYKSFQNKKNRILAKIFMITFPIFALFNFYFIEGSHQFNDNFLKVGSFAMIFFSCLYLVELLSANRRVNIVAEPMFWITSGVLLFNTGEFANNALSNIIFDKWDEWLPTFTKINHSLIFVLYSCISIALISMLWIRGER